MIKSIILSQFNLRFHPEFSLSVTTLNMNMYAVFLPRKEEETVVLVSENGWAHSNTKLGIHFESVNVYFVAGSFSLILRTKPKNHKEIRRIILHINFYLLPPANTADAADSYCICHGKCLQILPLLLLRFSVSPLPLSPILLNLNQLPYPLQTF